MRFASKLTCKVGHGHGCDGVKVDEVLQHTCCGAVPTLCDMWNQDGQGMCTAITNDEVEQLIGEGIE